MRRKAPRAGSRSQRLTTLVLCVLIAVPVAIALLHEGFPSTDVQMEPKDVWVTNSREALAGRLNAQIAELDGSVSLSSSNVTLMQDGEDVFLQDGLTGTLGRVDPAYTDLRESISTPTGSVTAYGGGVLAILDPGSGRVWALDATTTLNFDASSAEPDFQLAPDGQIAVTTSGVVVGIGAAGAEITRLEHPGAAPEQRPIDGVVADFQLTTVGDRAIVMDRETDRVLFDDGSSVQFDDDLLHVQLPGAESDRAVVATATGLQAAPMGGGVPMHLGPEVAGAADASGSARPANAGGCAYGAWAASATLVRACQGDEAEVEQIPGDLGGPLEFRVNREVVALNDLQTGNVWLPQENMRLVENWKDTVPPEDEDGAEGENDSTEQSFEDTIAERSDENHPPELNPDEFGVRAGETAYLPVLDNDSDPDGDIITIADIQGTVPPEVGALSIVDEGRALQFTAAESAASELTLTYVGDDGRGGVAQTTVTIHVLPASTENRPPESNHTSNVSVEAGQQVVVNVLGDWLDPDGDPVYVQNAVGTPSLEASTSPDGRITISSLDAELGPATIQYTVSDGSATAVGELNVTVEAPGSLAPVGTPDFARGLAGSTVTVSPLLNDLSPSGKQLTIRSAEPENGASGVTFNSDLGTVSIKSQSPGIAYVQYTVSDGTLESKGLIRFDVLDPELVEPSVTAVRDVAYVRPNQPADTAVLDNDVSTSDAVLSVQQVGMTDEARIANVAVELIDNTTVRVTASAALTAPIEIPYTITDGELSDDGTIVLVPVEPASVHKPPVGVDDSRRVRAGDYTSVDVLANDSHPDGAPIRLEPELTDLQIGNGYAFVSGDQVRFQAPNEPGTYSVGYLVSDEFGEQGGARVTFTVQGPDEASNRPPEPIEQVARVFEGASILVKVPLTGVDPDGDSVTFNGVKSSPTLGAIRSENENSFVYEAFPGAKGTDVIRYEVVDGYGQPAEGVIRIGVVPRSTETLPPVAVNDLVTAKPGSRISVPVLANDSDPGGYTIEIVPDFPEVPIDLNPQIDGRSIVLTLPPEGEALTVPYSITNGHGGTATAYIQVTLDPDAPFNPPTAADHVVPRSAFDGASSAEIDVRAGATNPTGRADELVVSLVGTNASLGELSSDGTITVTPRDTRQVIAYALTSVDTGMSASGFIMVPAFLTDSSKRQSPYLKPDLPAQVTPVDTAKSWDLGDIVQAPSGNRVTLIEPETAWAEQGNGSAVAAGDSRVQFTPKPGFRGTASITFKVTDSTGPTDVNAGIATIRLEITVGDPDLYDVPPTFVTPQVTVEQGGERTFDLSTATGHPNKAVVPQVSFSGLSGAANGVTASLSGGNGSTLKVSASLGATVGTIVPLHVTYTFRDFVQQGTINVTVVSSNQPPPRAVDDQAVGLKGQGVSIDVLANDYNPFPGQPLRLVEAVDANAGATGATVSIQGGQVRVVPSPTFVGEITVRYAIGDATGDPNRQSYGTATLRIRDVPSAPGSVSLTAAGPSTLLASWGLAQSNGEPISRYELVLTPVGSTSAPIVIDAGNSTSRTITSADGIRLGASYIAQVRAINAIGEGPFSAVSASAMPLDKPQAPQSVTVSNGFTAGGTQEGSLTVTWRPPAMDGGLISGYRINIESPASARDVANVGPGTLSYTFDGLKSGPVATEFLMTVTAINVWGESTSNPATGTLTYRAPTLVISAGAAIDKSVVPWTFYVAVRGESFLVDRTYQLQCFTGGSVTATGTSSRTGAQLNAGTELDCRAVGETQVVVVVTEGGKEVVRAEKNPF
ncbi:hypothetical protein F8O01_05145 [Pseudoclavibacter chungangensis]|uniref:Fibronectin type-III domain-containing protein n=1 Tax=Pseudoclavibacter chungangensis TaxID=587635 RepID=A0A7J5BZA4_9MICO|nr:Ig-like domain-containing protein [Pseudoclavibacter chungangensis]KAB1659649.1 hypothetical protein F8O01_05145 [Pseudoclavibacter chungangensis]NYJ67484.1 hypothetical protein [Pseudoclavibacter chungangensis]